MSTAESPKSPEASRSSSGGRRAPRVWPVALVFVLFVGLAVVGGGLLAVMFIALERGGVPSARDLQSGVATLALTSGFMIASLSLSVFLGVAGALTGALLSPAQFRDRLRLRGFASIGVVGISVLCLLAIGQSVQAVQYSLGMFDGTSAVELIAEAVKAMSRGPFVVFLILGSVGAGVAEELFFRGYMQTRLVERFGVATGIVLTSLAFAFVHFDLVHSTFAFFVGLYIGWLAEASGGIVLPIVAHVGNNFVAFVATRLAGVDAGTSVGWLAVSVVVAAASYFWLRRRLCARPG